MSGDVEELKELGYGSVMTHQWLQYAPPKPNRRAVREVAVSVMNSFHGVAKSRGRWLKSEPQTLRWWTQSKNQAGQDVRQYQVSKPIDIRMIERRLSEGDYTFQDLGIYELKCNWLDVSVHAGPQFHAVGRDGTALKIALPTTLGDAFPLVPTVDREGYAFNSFQTTILSRISELRERVVSNSSRYTEVEWFQDLRAIVSECISVVDITLHQLYFKAQYDPLPGWVFDEAALGPRHGRRLSDKLGWVCRITGKHLCAHEDMAAFIELKEIRNHLQHFDPPCFCYTLEDVARWLNSTTRVASLLWKMRKALGSPLCGPLMQLLLAPEVLFVPADPRRRRLPQPVDVGYGSTRWPET